MLVLQIPEQFFGIKLYRTICNERSVCRHRVSDLDCNNGYYCFNPERALFVRHTRINKAGVKYAYGAYFCCAEIVKDGKFDMFSSSEKRLMEEKL